MKRILLCISLVFLCSCTKEYTIIKEPSLNDHSLDSLSFKNEFEAANNESIYKLEISEDNPFQYSTLEEINEIIKSGSGITFFGNSQNIYTRALMNSFIEQANKYKISKVYYLDLKDLRDELYLDDDAQIAIKKEAADGYQELLSNLHDYASVYDGLNDDSIKRIYLPTIVIVVDGEIIYFHEGTLPSQTDPTIALSEEQINELSFDISLGFIRYNARVNDLVPIEHEEQNESGTN